MHRGNSDLSQRLLKRKVSIRHSLDTSVAQSRGLNPVAYCGPGAAATGGTASEHNNGGTCNPYFRSILSSKRSAGSETNIGSITLATATGSTPAIKLEVQMCFHWVIFISIF